MNLMDGTELIVSGFPQGTAGGTFHIDADAQLTRLDWFAGAGICWVNSELATAEWTDAGPTTVRVGDRQFPINADNPHDLVWDGEHLILVSTGTNELVRFDINGNEVGRWQAHPARDAWHISGLTVTPKGLAYTAFGRYDEPLGWADGRFREDAQGFLTYLGAEEDIVGGLIGPHTPQLHEDGWWYCSSADGKLITPGGTVQLDGWTRGLLVTETRIFIGLSTVRLNNESDVNFAITPGRVGVMDRNLDWLGEIQVPSPNIYSIIQSPGSSLVAR